MALLRKAMNEQAFVKAGMLGFAGSGKTTTASMLAIGIAKRLADGKPVAFFDTETGSDFLIPKFEAEGVELLTVKSTAFPDLLEAGKEAEQACSVLIVDSITHVWTELNESQLKAVNAGLKKRNRAPLKKLEFQHMAEVKRTWALWTSFFINSKLHILVCGRAGFEWEWEQNEDTGKKELTKVGTKMKVESEFGFEPSLLIEMERVSKGPDAGAGWLHRAHILKDRTDTINGKAFDFEKPPKAYKAGDWARTFKPFEPVVNALNIGGAHVALDTTRTNDGLFNEDGQSPASVRASQVEITLESIQNTLVLIWPGLDQLSKQLKLAVVESVFGERSWKAVEKKPLEALQNGLALLRDVEAALKDRGPVESAADLASLVQTVLAEQARLATAAENEAAAVEGVF
jgi:hypothetical protein